MNPPRWCDFPKLEVHLVAQFHADSHSIHGPSHWRRVAQNGCWLASRTGADPFVTRLFAWFHDSRRINDGADHNHGLRGAEYAASLRGFLFDMEDASFDQLYFACQWHTDKDFSDDPTIGTCWDADRLDLGRVGVIPSQEFMSTPFAKQVAQAGSFYPFLTETERIEHSALTQLFVEVF